MPSYNIILISKSSRSHCRYDQLIYECLSDNLMIKYHRITDNILIAELTDDKKVITQIEDALNLISEIGPFN